jgi:hypothetical protein
MIELPKHVGAPVSVWPSQRAAERVQREYEQAAKASDASPAIARYGDLVVAWDDPPTIDERKLVEGCV